MPLKGWNKLTIDPEKGFRIYFKDNRKLLPDNQKLFIYYSFRIHYS
jgi:hypothetical protein